VQLEAFGEAAWRARLPEGTGVANARALLEALRAMPGVVDVVVSERHVLVVQTPGTTAPPAGLSDVIERTLASAPTRIPVREHRVRVCYDGPDLSDVARAAGVSREEVVALHSASRYAVAAIGFLPGFAYLRGLDSRLVLPRRSTPRPRVPALSVAIAGPYTGVYPFSSPGGWHLLGVASGFVPFDPGKGATLTLGDRVTFEAVP
jgi:5-oxoprolinase (ATP-hydrolysing) subunit A